MTRLATLACFNWWPAKVATMLHTKSLVLPSMKEIQNSLHRNWELNACILSLSASRVNISSSYSRMAITKDLYSLCLEANLMLLLCQIIACLAVAPVTDTILMQMSSMVLTYLKRVATQFYHSLPQVVLCS